MLGIFKKTCTFCGGAGSKGFRIPDRLNAFVCKGCYERWEGTGRTSRPFRSRPLI